MGAGNAARLTAPISKPRKVSGALRGFGVRKKPQNRLNSVNIFKKHKIGQGTQQKGAEITKFPLDIIMNFVYN
jgi:hypothetical protein